MKEARELVIWGYSLPPTDFYSQWLFRQAPPHRLERVRIINPEVGKDEFRTRLLRPHLPGLALGGAEVLLYRDYADFKAERPWKRLVGAEIC